MSNKLGPGPGMRPPLKQLHQWGLRREKYRTCWEQDLIQDSTDPLIVAQRYLHEGGNSLVFCFDGFRSYSKFKGFARALTKEDSSFYAGFTTEAGKLYVRLHLLCVPFRFVHDDNTVLFRH